MSNLTLLPVAILVFAAVDPVTIKRVPTVGQTTNYLVDGTLTIQGADHKLVAKNVEKVTAVEADGTLTTETTETEAKMDGQDTPPQSAPDKVVQKATGEVVSMEGPGADQHQGRFQAIIEFYYPAKAVSVGDSWTFNSAANPKIDSQPIEATFKLVGDEKVGNWDAWKVEEDVKETEGDTPATAHSTFWIDKTDGRIIKDTSKFMNLPLGGTTVNGAVTVTRTQ